MKKVKVHITLAKTLLTTPDVLKKVALKICKARKIIDVNEKRLLHYGILSGLINDDQISVLKKMEYVESVDLDEEKQSNSTGIADS